MKILINEEQLKTLRVHLMNEQISDIGDVQISEQELEDILDGYLNSAIFSDTPELPDFEAKYEPYEKSDFNVDSLIDAYVDIKKILREIGNEAVRQLVDEDSYTTGMYIWLFRNGNPIRGKFYDEPESIFREKIKSIAKKMGKKRLDLNDDGELIFVDDI